MQKDEILVSIIIPIYNVENYLEKCIVSILQQDFKKFELILVNDGSTDNSISICEKYSKIDKRVKVINKENGGVSSARNIGIKSSLGKYIQFVDGDDTIEPEMTEKLYQKIKEDNSDLVICGYNVVSATSITKKSCISLLIKNKSQLESVFPFLYKEVYINSPCNKLYRRDKIFNFFDEEMQLGEDLIFNLNYLSGINKISFIQSTLYNYMLREKNSATTIFREDLYFNELLLYNYVNKFMNNNFSVNVSKKEINSVFIGNVIMFIFNLKNNSNNKYLLLKIDQILQNDIVINAANNVELVYLQHKIMNYFIVNKSKTMIYVYLLVKSGFKKIQDIIYDLFNLISNYKGELK